MKLSKILTVAKARRAVQAACLALFCMLLGAAQNGNLFGIPADMFLRMDPLAGVAVPIAARAFIAPLAPALVVVFTAALVGRVFCGWICPMGATLEAAGSLVRRTRKKTSHDPASRHRKYILLASVSAAAALGTNIAFWVCPIPLVTRLYALVLHPLGLIGLDEALAAAGPVIERMGATDPLYWFPTLRSYHTAWFTALFWLGLILLERVGPRFWCRHLCPAGALLGLASRLSPWRRRASGSCNACGRCAASCPAGVLHEDFARAEVSECFACRTCETVCTRRAVRFGLSRADKNVSASSGQSDFLPSRRAFVGAAATGVVLAGATKLKDARRLTGASPLGNVVRPPGSLPETDFLSRCVRCGECMKACPTGGLQPAMLQAGFSGMFSPYLDPRSGPCDPECAACGAVCPSRAIQALPLKEKRWAKIGTAAVDQKRCLAWGEDKRCMVCQETCPYGAVKVVPLEGHIAPVPVVDPKRCYGCGFCEKHCPTVKASIRVEPAGALRRFDPLFENAAGAAGLELDPARHDVERIEYDPQGGGAPPGFLD